MFENYDIVEIKYKKLNTYAKEPTHGSDAAAGYDLYSLESRGVITIQPHTTTIIETGIAIELPEGTFGAIFARSGLATQQGLRPANCVGVIDSDYRGEIKIALHNDTNSIKTIAGGDRIAQLVVLPYLPIKFKEVDELTETERGSGGFGSTGNN